MVLKGELSTVEVVILRRSNTATNEYWDANWLESAITVQVDSFRAHYGANLRADELSDFNNDLNDLVNLKTTKIIFSPIEEGLYLELSLESHGGVKCGGKSVNHDGNVLFFKFGTDIEAINNFIAELGLVLKSYPVIGKK